MIVRVESPDHAKEILRSVGTHKETIVFDIPTSIRDWKSIPLTFRRCKYCKSPPEHYNWDVQKTIACPRCKREMHTLASVAVAIQGDKVLQLAWRKPKTIGGRR